MLIDSRRGLKENDIEVMEILDEFGVSYQIVLTKSDEIKNEEIEKVVARIKKIDLKHTALHPKILITSSKNKTGLIDLMDEIASFIKI